MGEPGPNDQRQLLAALQAGAGFPHPVAGVRTCETHISWVLLTGDFAYKFKKRLDLGFLDFSTLELRAAACREELRLNRRYTQDLYLAVLPVTGSPSAPRIGGEGPPLEWCVQMRQFPEADRLDHVLERGELQPAQVDRLARRIAAWHAAAPRAEAASAWGAAERVQRPALRCLADLQSAGDAELAAQAAALQSRLLAEYAALRACFAARKSGGFIRECHGDLHLGNLLRWQGEPAAFDALEFNPGLRWIDVQSDVAFTVMDLLDRGRSDFAHRLYDGYLAESGDYAGVRVARFYQTYRALVRANVAAIRAGQCRTAAATGTAAADQVAAAQAECRGYLRLAEESLHRRRPLVVALHGVSGVGKSSWAAQLVESWGAVRLRADVERKRLLGLDPAARTAGPLRERAYSAEHTSATYARLLEAAEPCLAAGRPVVLDATYLRRAQRDAVRQWAADQGTPLLWIGLAAQAEELRRRLATRAALGGDPSEADATVLARQLAEAEPLATDEEALLIDTQAVAPTELPRLAAARLAHLAGR